MLSNENIVPVETLIPGILTDELTDLEEYLQNEETYKRKFRHCGSDLLEFYSKNLDMFGYLMLEDGVIPFENQVVVDLGAGSSPYGYIAAKNLGAKAYVAVEPFHTMDLVYNMGRTKWFKEERMCEEKEDIPFSIVAEDMLSFLKRIPENSVSCLCAGIDVWVIRNGNYLLDVGKEISRTTHEKGSYLNLGSNIIPKTLTKIYPTEERLFDDDGVYKKI
jgi:hypothetical protein